MNKRQMQKWVKALRSGKYQQGKGRLRRGDNYCCLGVLCEINGVKAKPARIKNDAITYSYDNSIYTLPITLTNKLNIKTSGVVFSSGRRYMSLVGFNDGVGKSFMQIASIIEKNYKKF